MITRGHLIGEIVDTLSDISGQVQMRGKLGLTDLNILLENFFKTTLNYVLGISLENLNSERSNFPGLDLGDKSTGWAFQVTSDKSSSKINNTLKKISDKQVKDFPNIIVLIIGAKQKSYSLDKSLCNRVNFSEEKIWSVETLCKQCMDLPIDKLQTLYNHVRSEYTRIKIELEIPNEEGKYPTSAINFFEAIPKAKLSKCKKFYKYIKVDEMEESISDVKDAFKSLSKSLAKLPRITREFYYLMIERREHDGHGRLGDILEINADKLDRISSYPDHEGELRLLQAYGLIDYVEPEHRNLSGSWRICLPETFDGFAVSVINYAEENSIPLARPLVNLDFSDF